MLKGKETGQMMQLRALAGRRNRGAHGANSLEADGGTRSATCGKVEKQLQKE